MEEEAAAQTRSAPRRNERTCIGCTKRSAPGHLVRLVRGADGAIVADLTGRESGRGAHVHPAPQCISKAAQRGLSRAFRTALSCDPAVLRTRIAQAAHLRVAELLATALGSGQAVVDRERIERELPQQALSLVILAGDAPPDSMTAALGQAVLQGRAVSWGTCTSLGALAGCEALAVVGVRSSRLGDAIAQVCRVADGARTGAEVR